MPPRSLGFGELWLSTGTLTYSDFEGEKTYEGINANLGLNLSGGKQQPGQIGLPNTTLEGSYQLDDTRQIVRATIGDGTIEIRNEEQQAALEENRTTAPVEDINRDPEKAWEITSESMSR